MVKRSQTPLEDAWRSFRLTVIPPTASAVQVSEMRKAFFAGAAILQSIITRGMSEDEEPTEEDLALMETIHDELVAFGRQFDADFLANLRSPPPQKGQ